LILLIFILSVSSLHSFEFENKLNIGLDRSYQWHSSDFRSIDSIPTCCFNIEEGLSNSLAFYLNYKVKVFDNLSVGLGFNYMNMNGKVNSFKNEAISIDGVDYDGKFEYAVEQNSTLMNYSIIFDYKVYKELYFNLNFAISNLNNMEYYQYEKLVNPSNRGYFIQTDSSKSRLNNEFRGDIGGSSINYLIGASLIYEFPLNEKGSINLTPSLGYSVYLGELVENTDWSFSNLNLGLGINYYFHKDTIKATNELNIDKTLLLAPIVLSKGKEVLRNELEYSTYDVELDLITIGLTAKDKRVNFRRKIGVDDSLRLYYKFGKFNEIINLELISQENEDKESKNLALNKERIDFLVNDLINKFQEKVSFNLRIKDKQRIYSKNAYSYVDKFYYSEPISIKFNEIDKKELKLTLINWKGSLDEGALFETIKSKLISKENIKSVYSNSELGLKTLQYLDNARINYNPDEVIPKVLNELIKESNYIIINEN